MARKELEPVDITIVEDTREQTPLDFSALDVKVISGTLDTGDYSILGLENVVTVERKSLPDLLGCIGKDRDRFDREMHRILAFPHKMLMIESTWREIEAGTWLTNGRSRVHPNAVVGSLIGWMSKGIPIFFAGNHADAARAVARFLFMSARTRWREAVAMCDSLKIATKEKDLGAGNA